MKKSMMTEKSEEKKLAYKEEIVKAKSFLEGLKGKYYEEVKLSSKLAPEQKEAIEFYNAYKEEQSKLTAQQQTQANNFTEKTNSFLAMNSKVLISKLEITNIDLK